MRGNPEQPRRKLRRGLVRASVPIHSQKYFLRQLLGHSVVLDHPEEEMDYTRAMFVQQDTEARPISFFDAEH
jgi:hypothetical protein